MSCLFGCTLCLSFSSCLFMFWLAFARYFHTFMIPYPNLKADPQPSFMKKPQGYPTPMVGPFRVLLLRYLDGILSILGMLKCSAKIEKAHMLSVNFIPWFCCKSLFSTHLAGCLFLPWADFWLPCVLTYYGLKTHLRTCFGLNFALIYLFWLRSRVSSWLLSSFLA